MKKIILLICAVLVISLVFCACENNGGNTLATAESTMNVTGENGNVSLTEDVAKEMLGAFSSDVLGLQKEIGEYDIKLSATRVFDSDACLVEALNEDDSVAGTFAILGYDCFVFDNDSKEYLMLTSNGAVKVEMNKGETETAQNSSSFSYDVENHKALLERFSKYSSEELGFPKALSEYILGVSTVNFTDDDGKTVYIINVFEKDGTSSGLSLGFNEENDYVYNEEEQAYIKLN